MDWVFNFIFKNSDLILNIIGTLLIAFSFGKHIGEAYDEKINPITKKEIKVYLVSFLHPLLFKIGCGLLIIGFIIALVKRL